MRARIGGATACAGLAIAVLAAGCGVQTENDMEKQQEGTTVTSTGGVIEGTIDRIVSNDVNAPGTVYFSFSDGDAVTYNCEIARVNDCALLRAGDDVTVTFEREEDSVVSPGVQYVVLDLERKQIAASDNPTPPTPTPPS